MAHVAVINVGFEHRNDHTQFQPDSSELSGLLSGFGGAVVSIDNSQTVKEGFIELRAPLVQDKFLAKDLVADVGYRRSDYDLIGNVNTYKMELQWAPLPDIRFRGSYNRAIRAPSIIELYNPQLVGQIGFVFQILTNVFVECGGERSLYRRITGIVLGAIAGGVEIRALQAAVVPPDRFTLFAQQLLAESLNIDPQIGLLDIFLR